MYYPGDIVYIGNERYEVIECRPRNDWKAAGLEPELPCLLGYGILAKCIDAAGNVDIDMNKKQYFLDIDVTRRG
jgi:hypothetical protein